MIDSAFAKKPIQHFPPIFLECAVVQGLDATVGKNQRHVVSLRKNYPKTFRKAYYKWTRKVAGKTVNAILTQEQAAPFMDWIRNMRNPDRIVRGIQATGLRAATLQR